MLRALKHDEEVKRVWTIDGSFHCIVMEWNVEVKKRLDSPDDLFKLGWSEQKMENSGLFSHHYRNCATIQSPPDGYISSSGHYGLYYLLLLIIIFKFSILCFSCRHTFVYRIFKLSPIASYLLCLFYTIIRR